MKRIERIEAMETRLNACTEAAEALERALTAFEEALPAYRVLSSYYGSPLWRKDFEADEAGRLPPGLKRGVLSEDAVYDLITDCRALAARMHKAAEAAERA